MQARAQTVVREPAFVLWSPLGAEPTAPYADVVREQTALVRRLFADTLHDPLRMYLVALPVDAEPASKPWQRADRGGLLGEAFDEGYAYVFVPESSTGLAALLQPAMTQPRLRHEIAHLCARRSGLVRARWFHEGMACDVEVMAAQGNELIAHPFPPMLIMARDTAHAGSVAELLHWERNDTVDEITRSRYYVQSLAFFRFLCERQPSGTWLERARAAWDLDDAHVLALESEWLTWLAHIDVVAEIRRGTQSKSAAQRTEAAQLLPYLAAGKTKDVLTRAADELAIELLNDRDATEPASTFLLIFRAKQLTDADVDHLAASTEPGLVLVAEALHAQRKEFVDADRARAAWSRLSAADQLRFGAAHALIPASR
jgi:hypothetical protein